MTASLQVLRMSITIAWCRIIENWIARRSKDEDRRKKCRQHQGAAALFLAFAADANMVFSFDHTEPTVSILAAAATR